jgi:hypothetical protein
MRAARRAFAGHPFIGLFSLAMLRWGYQGAVLTVGGKGTMEAGQVHS